MSAAIIPRRLIALNQLKNTQGYIFAEIVSKFNSFPWFFPPKHRKKSETFTT